MTTARSTGDVRAGAAPADSRRSLRDNLESIAVAILLVLVVRQMVVEAFKIPTGSMAPTLLGYHREVLCPKCAWVFRVGHDKLSADGEVQCPNCLYRWRGAWDYYDGPYGPEPIRWRRPPWLWHAGHTESGRLVTGTDAANRIGRWGSRIFVNKFIYRLREPRRWEVVVFLYPFTCNECGWRGELKPAQDQCPVCGSANVEHTRKNYIKRLVGMPGERIALQNGDVYVDGEITRKPAGIQKRMWLHVLDSAYVPEPEQEVVPTWRFDPGSEPGEGGAVSVHALEADEASWAVFARPVVDFYAYNARPTQFGRPGSHEVGDCRLELRLTVERCRPEGEGAVKVRITEDEHDFVLSLPAGGEGDAVLWDGESAVATRRVAGLRPGKDVVVVLENYDDFVAARLGGETLFEHSYRGSPIPRHTQKQLSFGAAGADVVFRRVRIQRDLYYVDRNPSPQEPVVYELAENSYLFLGDNSPASRDSRVWPAPGVPRDHLVGEAVAVFWPIHDMQALSMGSR